MVSVFFNFLDVQRQPVLIKLLLTWNLNTKLQNRYSDDNFDWGSFIWWSQTILKLLLVEHCEFSGVYRSRKNRKWDVEEFRQEIAQTDEQLKLETTDGPFEHLELNPRKSIDKKKETKERLFPLEKTH